jgi:hypothetical protein
MGVAALITGGVAGVAIGLVVIAIALAFASRGYAIRSSESWPAPVLRRTP